MSSSVDHGLPDLFEVRITGALATVRDLVAKLDLDVGCRHPHVETNADRTVTVLAFASEAKIAEIASAGLKVERGTNVSALGRERQAEVGKGDRFEGGKVAPEGLGTLVTDGEGRGRP
jgi:hypothetical protein